MLIYKLLLTDRSWRCAGLATMVTNLSPSNYHVCARKVNRREDLLRRILSAARHINNAVMLCKVSTSLISRLVKCVHVDGSLFEQAREQI